MSITFGRRATVPAVLLLVALAGCGSSGGKRFVPSEDKAREALEAYLNSWKNGEAVGRVKGHTPPIDVVDSKRKPGDKLAGYEIGGEDSTPEGNRRFAVKLTLQQPAGTQEDHYVVVGLDPLWVYREDDYKKLSGQ